MYAFARSYNPNFHLHEDDIQGIQVSFYPTKSMKPLKFIVILLFGSQFMEKKGKLRKDQPGIQLLSMSRLNQKLPLQPRVQDQRNLKTMKNQIFVMTQKLMPLLLFKMAECMPFEVVYVT